MACMPASVQGEVCRARDTKLGREVAIKVLPEEISRDKDRSDRFEHEARLRAQLNHQHVATLHALEEHERQLFLVMELVEGETLAERIARGPLSLDEALPFFIQIAEGVEAARASTGQRNFPDGARLCPNIARPLLSRTRSASKKPENT